MDHPIDHALGIVPMLCDALAGLAPRGFASAEIVFERTASGYAYSHVATLGAGTPWTVLDASACIAVMNTLGNDLAAELPDWDRRVSLRRDGVELELTVGGRSARVVAADIDAHRLFSDAVLARVTTGTAEVAARQRAFDAKYGEPDSTWMLEGEACLLTTPHGNLRADAIGVYEAPKLHWGDDTSLPEPFTRRIRGLRQASSDPMYSKPAWLVLEPALAPPIVERAMLDLDLHRVIEWPVGDLLLFVGVS